MPGAMGHATGAGLTALGLRVRNGCPPPGVPPPPPPVYATGTPAPGSRAKSKCPEGSPVAAHLPPDRFCGNKADSWISAWLAPASQFSSVSKQEPGKGVPTPPGKPQVHPPGAQPRVSGGSSCDVFAVRFPSPHSLASPRVSDVKTPQRERSLSAQPNSQRGGHLSAPFSKQGCCKNKLLTEVYWSLRKLKYLFRPHTVLNKLN